MRASPTPRVLTPRRVVIGREALGSDIPGVALRRGAGTPQVGHLGCGGKRGSELFPIQHKVQLARALLAGRLPLCHVAQAGHEGLLWMRWAEGKPTPDKLSRADGRPQGPQRYMQRRPAAVELIQGRWLAIGKAIASVRGVGERAAAAGNAGAAGVGSRGRGWGMWVGVGAKGGQEPADEGGTGQLSNYGSTQHSVGLTPAARSRAFAARNRGQTAAECG